MKKGGLRVLLVLVGLAAVFLITGLALPTKYTVSSSVIIHAPRQQVHELISDLENWPRWEPWSEVDPSIEVTLGEKTSGVGASQSWADAHDGGELVFTVSDPYVGVLYDLRFSHQHECKAMLLHEPVEGGVKVTWSMEGDTRTPVIGGYFARYMPSLLQPMFDRGMQRLKEAAEGEQ